MELETDPQDVAKFASLAHACTIRFQELSQHEDAQSDSISSTNDFWMTRQSAEFNIWCNRLGVYSGGTRSIDVRLKDVPEICDILLRLLLSLQEDLDGFLAKNTELGEPLEDILSPYDALDITSDTSSLSFDSLSSSDSSSDHNTRRDPTLKLKMHTGDTIRRLQDHASRIEQAAAEHRRKRLAVYRTKPNTEEIHNNFRNLGAVRAGQDFKNAPDFVKQRLAEAFANRRVRFQYMKDHRRKALGVISAEHHINPNVQHDLNDKQPPTASKDTTQRTLDQQTIITETVPTEYHLTRTRTKKEQAESVRTVARNNPEFPKPPIVIDGSFRCPYCLFSFEESDAEETLWSRHVMRDFEPYFCLLEECETPFEVLNSFDGLLDHLQTHLRPKFHLRYDNADSMEYLEEGFEFQGRSADEITEQELTMLKQSHQRKEAFMFTTCVFCGGYPDCLHEKHPNRDTMEAQDDLRKHIKQHMQDNALLFPPPRSDDLDVDQGLESVDITLPRSDIEELAAETGDFVDFCDREQCDCKTSASWTTDENIPHLPESIDWQHILKGSSIYNIYGDVVDEFEQRYRYVSHLGHGNSGTVEEVLDQITGRIYARKTIRLSGTTFSREAATKIFQNEVKTFLSLEQHHHIIRIHTTYATSKALCILLEPVAREGDLDEYLADYEQLMRSTNITNPRAVAITATLEKGFGCLAAGLAFMHERRIRHKDIKPRNILIHEGTLIYINFGYAFVSDGLSRSTTEGPAEYLTRRYSPPEVIENKNRNSKSDVFSLGCVFVDMFLIMNRRKRAQPKEQLWAMMDSLHAQILSTATPAKLDILPHAIIGMTALQNSSRLCSTHVAAYLLERINLRCHQCASSPIDEWKERVRGDRCPPLQMEDPKLDIHRTGIQSTLSPLNNRHIGPPRTTSTFQPNTQTRYFWDSDYNRYQIQAYNHTTQLWEFSYWAAEQQSSSRPSQSSEEQAGASATRPQFRVDSRGYALTPGDSQLSDYYLKTELRSTEQPYKVAYSVQDTTRPGYPLNEKRYADSDSTYGDNTAPRYYAAGDYSQPPFSPPPQDPYQGQYNPRNQRRLPRGIGNNVAGTYNGPTTLHYEPIDHSFFVRPKPFFHEGRVFAVIMNETAGSTAHKPIDVVVDYTTPSDASDTSDASTGRVRYVNNHVYTNKRNFVVVRQKKEFCFACPIFTYGKRATKKPGVRAEEHGIIYSEDRSPQLIPGESGIIKSSIGVVMAEGQTGLQPESRIYYGIHHPIQYNVKVKDIGEVIQSHVPTLIGNWKEEDEKGTQQGYTMTAKAENDPGHDLEMLQED